MIRPGNKAPLLWCTGALLLVALTALRWPGPGWLQTDIFALLPGTSDSRWQLEANNTLARSHDGKLVLYAKGAEGTGPQEFLKQVAAELVKAGYLMPGQEQVEQDRWRALSKALYPYRRGLISAGDRDALSTDPAAFLQRFRTYLHSPLGGAALNTLPGDPMGLFRAVIGSAAPSIASGDGNSELRPLTLRPDQLGLGELETLYDLYLSWKARAAQQGLSFMASGPPLYSAFGAHSASREISTIGLASLLLLSLLLIVFLRSFRSLLLTLLCVTSGLACGLLTTLLLVQQIHLLTLVFGATLIGIAADYALHYLAHSLTPGWRREHALSSVYRSLSLGALSSVTAFAALALLPFPGIRQIGLFMSAGLLGSFATVCLLFPHLYSGVARPTDLPSFCHRAPTLQRWWPLALALLAFTVPGLWLLDARDEVRDFYATTAQLQADEIGIGKAAGTRQESRYFLVTAVSKEALLAGEARLLQRNRRQLPELELSAISQLIPAAQVQQENATLLNELASSGAISKHLNQLGFNSTAAASIEQQYQQGKLTAPTLEVLDPLQLPAGTGRFLGCGSDGCASYVLVRGLADPEQLATLASGLAGVRLVDQVAEVNRLLANYRSWILGLLLLGGLAATAVLLRATGWRAALRIIALPTTSCLLSFAALGYLHGHFSIVNLLALLLIIGVSLDYAVFRTLTPARDQAATSLAITLSAITSILAFGMLSFSSTPIISAFGQTIATGLVIAYGLSWLQPDAGRALA